MGIEVEPFLVKCLFISIIEIKDWQVRNPGSTRKVNITGDSDALIGQRAPIRHSFSPT